MAQRGCGERGLGACGLRAAGCGLRAAGGRLQWTHVPCTPELTPSARHAARGAAALEALGILPRHTGVRLHAGWTSSRHSRACRQARCTAHPLRELTVVEEALHQEWAGRRKHLLRAMRSAVEEARAAAMPRRDGMVHTRLVARYEARLGEDLATNPPPPPFGGKRQRGRRKQRPVRNLLDRLWTAAEEALRVRDDFPVPFDNNQAERDLRLANVQQKASGTFCSDAGADAFCRIRSVCSTWRKQGRSALDALERAFTGRSLSLQIPS